MLAPRHLYFPKVLVARHLYFSRVLAIRKKSLKTPLARKNKHTARMLADARKDHSIPLILSLPLADVDGFYNWSW